MIPQELEEIVPALSAFVSETFSCVSAPIQYGALKAFQNYESVRDHVELCRDIHEAAGYFLHKRFLDIGLNCSKPQGAFYLFPDFENYKDKLKSRGINSSTELTESLLNEVGVALLPGSDFYLPNEFLGVRVASVDYNGEQVLKDFPVSSKLNHGIETVLFPKLVDACERIEMWLQK